LADKLEILIKNPELRKKMGEAGRKKYEEEFTLERFEERMVEILNLMVND
jgi:glycosyltransferase involved in cell wall biosynthesis